MKLFVQREKLEDYHDELGPIVSVIENCDDTGADLDDVLNELIGRIRGLEDELNRERKAREDAVATLHERISAGVYGIED